jgi:hypothetical protein
MSQLPKMEQHPFGAVADELLATVQPPTTKKVKMHLDKVF